MSARRKRRAKRTPRMPKRLRDNPELNRRPVPLIGPPWRRLLCWLGLAHRDVLLWHTGPEIWVGVQTGHWPPPTVFCGWCGRSKVLPKSLVQQSVQHEPSLKEGPVSTRSAHKPAPNSVLDNLHDH